MSVIIPTLADRELARSKPAGPPVMYQRWEDLLFLHWEWSPGELQGTLPPGLRVDTHHGKAYLGIVPFKMRAIRPRFLPAVPGVSNFLELNLRTYVHDVNGVPGVWFYSLDANQHLAVAIARSRFSLPYFHARMSAGGDLGASAITYEWQRSKCDSPGSRFRYASRGASRLAEPGSLEFFLLERYVLFTERDGVLYSGRVHHPPYPFHDAHVFESDANLLEIDGFSPPERPHDHAVVSPGVQVSVYGLEPVARIALDGGAAVPVGLGGVAPDEVE